MRKGKHLTIKIASLILILILTIQAMIFGEVYASPDQLIEQLNVLKENYSHSSEHFVKDTIRLEQRRVLNNIRQAWVQYLNVNKDTELLEIENGKYVFENKDGLRILFDSETMIKHYHEGCYAILDKYTEEVIGEHMHPKWNKQTVDDIISIIANTVKLFNGDEGLIVYDVQTGEVLLNNTSLFEGSLGFHTQHVLSNKLFTKIDSQRELELTVVLDDLDLTDINNFEKYPLGSLDRLFVERVILPYESVGVYGLDMQIGIISVVSEQEVISPYRASIDSRLEIISSMESQIEEAFKKPIISICLSIFVILASIILVHINKEEDDI